MINFFFYHQIDIFGKPLLSNEIKGINSTEALAMTKSNKGK